MYWVKNIFAPQTCFCVHQIEGEYSTPIYPVELHSVKQQTGCGVTELVKAQECQ